MGHNDRATHPIGTYHLADNPQLYEVQRQNNFEFVVTDIDGIMRAGARDGDSNAYFNNAQEVLMLSVTQAFVPQYTQEVVQIKRGNSTLKYAGVPSFQEGSVVFNDYIGADVKAILLAWQNLSYNVYTEKVGSLDVTNYKKDCYLIEYTPDYRKIRQWILHGCWISNLQEGEYSSDNGDKHQITCTFQYDHSEIDTSDISEVLGVSNKIYRV